VATRLIYNKKNNNLLGIYLQLSKNQRVAETPQSPEIYGVTLAPFIISLPEFRKRAGSGKPPVNNILKEGKIIYGKQFITLLK
jgi:hypothetical protein